MLITLNILIILIIVGLSIISGNNMNKIKQYSFFFSSIIFLYTLYSLVLRTKDSFFEDYQEQGIINIINTPNVIINYTWCIDNISVVFLLLTTLLIMLATVISYNIMVNVKLFYIQLFLIELFLINAFTTTELIFFYIFFEGSIIPVFLMIGKWGSQKIKVFAANQFFIYTIMGSFCMLSGIIFLYITIGTGNISILQMINFPPYIERFMFILFFIAFAVKIPIMPVHLWLPKAHVEAPTTGSVLLAGILLKLGTYGLLRYVLLLFPNASIFFAPLVASLAIFSITFASLNVFRQLDLKRIIAYSSIAHMNFIVLSLFTKNLIALSGALLLQIGHGLSSAALFFLVGVLYDRYETRNIYYFRGLVTIMPWFVFFFFVCNLANLAFPGTINFASEMLMFLGVFSSLPSIAMTVLIGVFLAAVYSFILITRICYGPASTFIHHYSDLNRREVWILFVLVSLIIIFGICPTILTQYMSVPLLLLIYV